MKLTTSYELKYTSYELDLSILKNFNYHITDTLY